MKKMFTIACMLVIMICISGITIYADEIFDEENIENGIIGVKYESESRLKVMIKHDDGKYVYDLNGKNTEEYFPLQMGNGSYKIYLYENTTGTKYKKVSSTVVEVSLDDENDVFLNSVQVINFKDNTKTVEKAVELTKDIEDLDKKIEALWEFMVNNNDYDYEKLATLKSTYLPTPDNTLKDGEGICYDFSSLLASMLRSEGIPAKLIKGYAPDYAVGYHAWNEIYDEKNDKWVVVDSTYDIQTHDLRDYYDYDKDEKKFQKVYEY